MSRVFDASAANYLSASLPALSTNQDWSFACYLKPDVTNIDQIAMSIAENGAATNPRLGLGAYTDGKAQAWEQFDTTGASTFSDSAVTASIWQMIFVTYDASTGETTVYNNSTTDTNSSTNNSGIADTVDRLILGAWADSTISNAFDGKIAQAMIWKGHVLTTTDIQAVLDATTTRELNSVQNSTLYCHFPLIDDDLNDAMEVLGELTVNGTVASSTDEPLTETRARVVGTPTVINDGGSYTAESGSNRLVVFTCGKIGVAGTHIDSLDFGTFQAEKIFDHGASGSGDLGSCFSFMVREADIPTGSQTVGLTLAAAASETVRICCYTLENVDQITPHTIRKYDRSTSASTSDATMISMGSGDHSVLIGDFCDDINSGTATPPDGFTVDINELLGTSGRWGSVHREVPVGDFHPDIVWGRGSNSGDYAATCLCFRTVDNVGLAYDVATVSLATSGDNQDIEFPNLDCVPKCIMAIWAKSSDAASIDAQTGIGFGDDYKHANRTYGGASETPAEKQEFMNNIAEPYVLVRGEDGVTTTNTDRWHGDEYIASTQTNTAAPALDSGANLASYAHNKIRLAVGNLPASAYLVTYIAFGGEAVEDVIAGFWDDIGGTAPIATEINDPNFQADVVFMAHVGLNSVLSANTTNELTNNLFGFGAWSRANAQQMSICTIDRPALTTTETNQIIFNDKIASQIVQAVTWHGTASADANGFDFTTGGDDGGSDLMFYMALKLATDYQDSIEIIETTLPASGDYSETGFSFKPDLVILDICNATVEGSIVTDADMVRALSVLHGTDMYTHGHSSADNVSTTETCRFSRDGALALYDPDTTTKLFEATSFSFQSGGYTMTPSTNDGRQRKGFAIGFRGGLAISSVTPSSWQDGDTGIVIAGSGFSECP